MKNSNEEQSMSRPKDRDARDSDSRRHRSRFDREPSPKRSRRDGKSTTERKRNNNNLDAKDERHSRRLQERDAVPHEPPSKPGTKIVIDSGRKESDKKISGHDGDGAKSSMVPTDVPRSRSLFQHDERGQSSGRREPAESWARDSKDLGNKRETNKTAFDKKQRDEKSQSKGNDNINKHRDGGVKLNADVLPPPPPPLPRRRPAFSEQKVTVNPESAQLAAKEPIKLSNQDLPISRSERRVERGRDTHQLNSPEKHYAGDGAFNRRKGQRDGFASRDRYRNSASAGNVRGSVRFRGGQGYQLNGTRAEKWKHDLFEKSNWGPDPRNEEEDHIAKVEALLSS